MSQPLYFFFFLGVLSLSFFLENSTGNYTTEIFATICPSKACGNFYITYPFWLQNNITDRYCGYRAFNLSCDDEEKLIFSLPNNRYYVTQIDYDNKTLTLVDIDVTDNPDCPRARHNLTLDTDTVPLTYSEEFDGNLTFYFNCSSDSPQFGIVIDCFGFNVNKSYVSRMNVEPLDYHWQNYCQDKVVATMIRWGIINESPINTWFGRVMNQGFMLNWGKLTECDECELSDGRCGIEDGTQQFWCFCADGSTHRVHCRDNVGIRFTLKLAIGAAAVAMTILLTCIPICCIRYKTSSYKSIIFWKKKTVDDKNIEAFIRQYGSMAPKRYSYSEVKKMTNFLKDKLGQGGNGSVYKGILFDGRHVAVKILNASKGNGEEFINEVASISRTSHVNIVTLLGFCFEGRNRALIYEFMPNGSLEKFIYNEGPLKINGHLGWEKLYQIAIGIARGLEYLHRGCNTRILHFDIKPHNILLYKDFCPKISDFGLAKLCVGKESIVSMLGARGTIGYIAPEVFSRNFGGVSHKSDVYSYGMMVLEMVGGRKNIDVGVGHTSEIYFPHWIYKRLELDEELGLQDDMNKEENEIARRMIVTGLWCIQTDPSQRPSIRTVIEMLEGSIEALEIPPKPFLCSPPRSVANSSVTSIIL